MLLGEVNNNLFGHYSFDDFVTDKTWIARKTAPSTFVANNVEIYEGQMLASFEREGYFIGDDGILRVILTAV